MANEKSSVVYAKKVINNSGGSEAIYGLGVIGALIYFLQQASTLWEGVIGIIKAVFWPAVTVYEVLKLLNL